ncbi:L-asparaginase [Gautieria morchelliformis]|nr:L-asparaginase [Gautieria morchelliformis]
MMHTANESRVLVIYCGGTIGMLKSDKQGYIPEPFYLTETLRAQSRFHDPHEDSLFSHSSTVQGFRNWSKSGSATPIQSQALQAELPSMHTLLVRSPRPITLPPGFSGLPSSPSCRKISDDCYEASLPSMVTLLEMAQGYGTQSLRLIMDTQWNPLLDSSNLEPSDWVRLATEIELNYTFDAFVILHGTDTMAYTSSALSFLLEDLGKTVILTGAQIPLSQLRNDAVDNLLGALCIAGQFIIPVECCLFFNHTLYRGNRVSKSSSYDFQAFDSPNFPPLVNVGIDIVVNWNEALRQRSTRKFRAHKSTSNAHQIPATLRLFPGITVPAVRAFLAPPIQGVVLETFGSGNSPNRRELLDVLHEACLRGVVIVAISQCAKGSVSDAYETGRALLETGVVPGGDMTPECALTKLGYLLSKPELSPEQIGALVRTPLRGELTLSAPPLESQAPVDDRLENVQDVLSHIIRISSSRANPSTSTACSENGTTAVAPWTWTNAETLNAESALLPLLIHLATARNDLEALLWCINSTVYEDVSQGTESASAARAAGIVNCLDAASARSPLHVAALNGSFEAVVLLLGAGASVHMRDSLDHTALYYAARQGHEVIVDKLVEAGALLGGSDITGGFVSLAVTKSSSQSAQSSLHTWVKAGANIDS